MVKNRTDTHNQASRLDVRRVLHNRTLPGDIYTWLTSYYLLKSNHSRGELNAAFLISR